MNEKGIVNSGLRFVCLVALQIFLLKQISWGFGGKEYLFIFLYPLFIMLLPLQLYRNVVVILGFTVGLTVDLFYETLGVNAAAATLSAFLRPLILQFVRPQTGYNIKDNPTVTDLGWGWMLRYAALFLGVHLLLLFSFQAFTLYFWLDIVLKTVFTFAASYLATIFLVLVFNPKS